MPNKHFCQGPHCHTNPTTDRFLKSKGIIRGRYAYAPINSQSGYRYSNSDKYFCSQGCKLEWLHENMTLIEMGIPVPFIEDLLRVMKRKLQHTRVGMVELIKLIQ